MTLGEKLQHFYDRSMESAGEERDRILEDYQAGLDKMYEEHRAMKEKEAREAVKNEKTALMRDLNKNLALREIEIRHTLAQKEEDVLNEIFAVVKTKLDAYRETPDYIHFICRKIMIAKKVSGAERMIVYLDPADERYLEEIAETTDTRPVLADRGFGGGMRAVISSRHILIDNSFDTLFEDAKNGFSFEGGAV